MHKSYDDFDDFDFDDREVVRRMLQEQAREELRMASRRRKGAADKYRWDRFDVDSDEPGNEFDDLDDYSDYDEDEFDSYAEDWR